VVIALVIALVVVTTTAAAAAVTAITRFSRSSHPVTMENIFKIIMMASATEAHFSNIFFFWGGVIDNKHYNTILK
jgi:hypothetical protein